MIVTATFKTPDALTETLGELEKGSVQYHMAKALLEKHIEYGEYIYVDFDTETGTATVQEV